MLTRYVFLRLLAEIEWGWLRDIIGLIAACYFFLFVVFWYLPAPPIVPVRVSYPPVQNFTPDHLMAFELIWPQLPTNMKEIVEGLNARDSFGRHFHAADGRRHP